MTRRRAVIGLAAVVAALAVVLAVAVALMLHLAPRIGAAAVASLEERTGRSVELSKPVTIAFLPGPRFQAEGLRLANIAGGQAPHLLAIGRLEARLALLPLFRGNVVVSRLHLEGLDIRLEQGEEGRPSNWELGPAAGDAPRKPAASGGWALGEIEVDGAVIHYRRGDGRETPPFVVDRLDILPRDEDRAAVAAQGQWDDLPWSLEGATGSLARLLANKSWPAELSLTIAGYRAGLRGSLGRPMAGRDVQLALEVRGDAVSPAAEGGAAPSAPVHLTAVLRDIDGGWLLQDLHASAGESRVSGEARLRGGPRPRLQVQLSGDLIDYGIFLPRKERKRLFSDLVLPLQALRRIDARVELAAVRLRGGSFELTDLRATALLEDGRLALDIPQAGVGGGEGKARLTLDANTEPAVAEVAVDIRGLVPRALLVPRREGPVPLQGGRTDLRLELQGRGDSVAAFMAGANGMVLVSMADGRLPNSITTSDLLVETLRLLNPLAGQDDQTVLECAVFGFQVRDGIARSVDGIGIRTDKLTLKGGGSVDLRTEALDLQADAKPRTGIGINITSLGDVVRVGGTLARPERLTDTQSVATAGAKVGAAVLSGGLTVLAEGIYDRVTADDDVCAKALARGRGAGVPQGQEAAKAKAAPEKDSPRKASGAPNRSAPASVIQDIYKR